TGLILGPLSDWVNAGQFRIFTEYLGNFALILILFQAGYELHLRRRDAVYSSRGSLWVRGLRIELCRRFGCCVVGVEDTTSPGLAARRCVWMHEQHNGHTGP